MQLDGDDLGRGTSKFLDIYNQKGGTKTDINERNSEIKVNRYSSGNPYYVTSERVGNKTISATMKLVRL